MSLICEIGSDILNNWTCSLGSSSTGERSLNLMDTEQKLISCILKDKMDAWLQNHWTELSENLTERQAWIN